MEALYNVMIHGSPWVSRGKKGGEVGNYTCITRWSHVTKHGNDAQRGAILPSSSAGEREREREIEEGWVRERKSEWERGRVSERAKERGRERETLGSPRELCACVCLSSAPSVHVCVFVGLRLCMRLRTLRWHKRLALDEKLGTPFTSFCAPCGICNAASPGAGS